MAHTKLIVIPYRVIFLTLQPVLLYYLYWYINYIYRNNPLQRMFQIQWNFPKTFSKSTLRGFGIFLFNSSKSIQELILFLCIKSGSLVCHTIWLRRFWMTNPYSQLPIPISIIKEFFFYDFKNILSILRLFLLVAGKRSIIKNYMNVVYRKNDYSKMLLFYIPQFRSLKKHYF